jgi:hypothetical protein
MKDAVLSILLSAVLSSGAAAQAAKSPARYAQVMAEELAAMGIAAQCAAESAQREHCTFLARSESQEPVTLHTLYDDDTDTIYFHVESWLELPPERARGSAVLERLMELNWELLVGKLEWNPRTGEVRLSAVLNTDSNFDRRAFRSIVRALEALSARYAPELRALAQTEATL